MEFAVIYFLKDAVFAHFITHRGAVFVPNPNIALETEDETYFVILEVRETYVLLWTAFLSEYRHQSLKKLKERKKDIEAELEKKESYSEQISSCKETIEKMDKKLKAGKK